MQDVPSNSILDKLPSHLKQYIIPQNYSDYSPINQAVWRYVMRKNISFLSKLAHHTYVDGLKKTGVSVDQIPDMYGMNRILKDIGWAAAAVDGFIPPAAFMEFQAYNVLVIAVDIRTLEHIEYTPAPDIIHEAAGHAPIIANPEYAQYLQRLGEIGCKAISSKHDWDVYNAVRGLSQIKEQENADEREIEKAQQKIDLLQSKDVEASEMSKIRNLQWWTVEYGLIGELDNYKIYGAGLLSSIGESEWCLSEEVKKIPYSIAAAEAEFDITRPQPKLFVTPNFAHLSKVLEEFANKMALRQGGARGLEMLVDSQSLGSIELSTGLQISGIFSRFEVYEGNVCLVVTEGPSALSYRNKELIGHSTQKYNNGFISPIGKLKGINIAIEDMSPIDLEAYGIYEGQDLSLEFEGGIVVQGSVVTGTRNLKGKIILISLEDGVIKKGEETIFSFYGNTYNLAIGKSVISAFAGPADNSSFDQLDHELSPSIRNKEKSASQLAKEDAYARVRYFRESGIMEASTLESFLEIYDNEWLLCLEILELALERNMDHLSTLAIKVLNTIKLTQPKLENLISSGIAICEQKLVLS